MPALGTAGKAKRELLLARKAKAKQKSNQRVEEAFFPLFIDLKWKGFEVCKLSYFAKTGFCAYLIAQKQGAAADVYLMDIDFAPSMMHTVRELALEHGAAILVGAQDTLTADQQTLLAYTINEFAGKIRVNDITEVYPELAKLLNPSLHLTQ
jgi:hypothetical protein